VFTIRDDDIAKSSKNLRDNTVSGRVPIRLSTRLRSLWHGGSTTRRRSGASS